MISILGALGWARRNAAWLLVGALVVSLAINLQTCSSKAESDAEHRQNVAAVTEELRTERLKNGTIEASRAAYVTDMDGLRSLNAELWSKLSAFSKGGRVTGGDVVRGTWNGSSNGATGAVSRRDTVYVKVPDTCLSGLDLSKLGTWDLTWESRGRNRYLLGRTTVGLSGVSTPSGLRFDVTHAGTRLLVDTLGVEVSLLRRVDKDGISRVYAQSSDPLLTIRQLNSLEVPSAPRKDSRWGIGAAVGYGVVYGPQSRRFDHGVQLTVGLTFEFVRFKAPRSRR